MIRFMNHFARSVAERNSIIKFFQTNLYLPPRFLKGGVHYALPDECVAFTRSTQDNRLIGTESFLGMMYDYFTVGYANTLAYAHANSGDTMTSVMIGGLRTVMNGDFEIFAGDLVQFYWCVLFCRARPPPDRFPSPGLTSRLPCMQVFRKGRFREQRPAQEVHRHLGFQRGKSRMQRGPFD